MSDFTLPKLKEDLQPRMLLECCWNLWHRKGDSLLGAKDCGKSEPAPLMSHLSAQCLKRKLVILKTVLYTHTGAHY